MTKRLASLRSAGRAACPPAVRRSWTRTVRLLRRVTAVHEAGMTTAEYAIGTLAACGFAALLVTILRGGVVQGLLLGIIKRALALGG
jgi:uncharacterized protein DUF4244